MPRGSQHVEIGYLDHDGRSFGLRRDDGGRWRLHLPRRGRRMIGRRVRIEAMRVGHDELDVSRIEPLDPAAASPSRRMLIHAILLSAAAAIGLLAWVIQGGA